MFRLKSGLISVKQMQMDGQLPEPKGGLHTDFWTFKDHDRIENVNSSLVKLLYKNATARPKQIYMLWDTLFETAPMKLEQEVAQMRPRAVVVGDGLWFVWEQRQDYAGFRRALKAQLKVLVNIGVKVIL